LTAPSDPRLPNGGGYAVPGLYNVSAAGFATAALNNITDASNFGEQYQRYNGMLLNITARPRPGLTFQGGVNTGKQVNDYCEVRPQLPELTLPSAPSAGGIISPSNPYCHVDPGFITKVTGIGSYLVPKIDVLFAGTIRSDQGAPQRAT
jgi:hypothetical protein